VVTAEGGSTCHAAVVSRALGLPCVVGCGSGSVQGLLGRTVTVDGGAGRVYDGPLAVVEPSERDDPSLVQLAAWAAPRAPLKVYPPGQAPSDARIANLDHLEGGEEPETIPRLVAGHDGALGRALATDAGVAAAVKAGLKFIVTSPVLPALLAACAAVSERAPIEESAA
jgi:pyruvate,orthophosphate dikinase